MSNTNKWLNFPEGKVDMILDTDTFNEIDDQYAITYLLRYTDRINIVGFTVAPFENPKLVPSVAESQIKSKAEIEKLLKLTKRTEYLDKIYSGSPVFMRDENTPVESDAARFIIEASKNYNPDNRLYVVAIGAITNVASALLLDPTLVDRIVVVWLGGASQGWWLNCEYNMYEDYAASRVVMKSKMPFVWVPAHGVIMNFLTSKYELEHYLKGANPVCDYLYETAVKVAEENSPHKAWSRVIWDVVAVAFLVAKDKGFMYGQIKKRKLPCYEGNKYEDSPIDLDMFCIEQVDRDPLMSDLFEKITQK